MKIKLLTRCKFSVVLCFVVLEVLWTFHGPLAHYFIRLDALSWTHTLCVDVLTPNHFATRVWSLVQNQLNTHFQEHYVCPKEIWLLVLRLSPFTSQLQTHKFHRCCALIGEACAVTSQDDAHLTLDLNAVQIEPHCLHEKQLLASLATKFKAESEQNKYNEQLCVAKGMLHPELISHAMLDTLPAQKKNISCTNVLAACALTQIPWLFSPGLCIANIIECDQASQSNQNASAVGQLSETQS